MSGRYCITLVHGTFAPAAPWIADTSLLRRTLESELGTVDFACFGWDGRNDHEGRAEAAKALATKLSAQLDARPDTVHAIIAHSHGGNIALTAAADPRVAHRLGKVVCMSTPFFLPKERDVVTAMVNLVIAFLGFLGVTTLLCVLAYPIPRFAYLANRFELFRSAGDLLSWAVPATVALVVAVALWRLRKPIAALVAKRQHAKIREIVLPKPGSASVLCIWAKGDEVLSGFRLLDGLAGLTLILLRPWTIAVVLILTTYWLLEAGPEAFFRIQTLGDWFFKAMIVAFYPFAVLCEYIAGFWSAGSARHQVNALMLPLAVPIMATLTVGLLSALTFVAAAIVHWFLKSAPFGMIGWRFLDTFFLRIAAGPTLPDRAGVIAEEMRLSGRLKHSAVYKSEKAVKKIAAFIRA